MFGVVVHIYPFFIGHRQTLTVEDPHTFQSVNYFLFGKIRACQRVSLNSLIIFEFLSTDFCACSKTPSRDNHYKASYARTQLRDQGES